MVCLMFVFTADCSNQEWTLLWAQLDVEKPRKTNLILQFACYDNNLNVFNLANFFGFFTV